MQACLTGTRWRPTWKCQATNPTGDLGRDSGALESASLSLIDMIAAFQRLWLIRSFVSR